MKRDCISWCGIDRQPEDVRAGVTSDNTKVALSARNNTPVQLCHPDGLVGKIRLDQHHPERIDDA
jgi:hypothetical protein